MKSLRLSGGSVDKIDKFLRKLSAQDRERLDSIIERIVLNNLASLDVRKLKGRPNEYRLRVGQIRIIFLRVRKINIITDIQFRNDHTY
jgi:mRNA-degrading endonuclease RelE of RelBE toxin-antitoxin system